MGNAGLRQPVSTLAVSTTATVMCNGNDDNNNDSNGWKKKQLARPSIQN